MNLLLLEEADFIAADRVVLRDRRLVHMQEVHRAAVGDSLRVGRIGALMGNAQLLRLETGEAELQVSFDQPPPSLHVHLMMRSAAVSPISRLPASCNAATVNRSTRVANC